MVAAVVVTVPKVAKSTMTVGDRATNAIRMANTRRQAERQAGEGFFKHAALRSLGVCLPSKRLPPQPAARLCGTCARQLLDSQKKLNRNMRGRDKKRRGHRPTHLGLHADIKLLDTGGQLGHDLRKKKKTRERGRSSTTTRSARTREGEGRRKGGGKNILSGEG